MDIYFYPKLRKTQFDLYVSFIIPGPLDVREHIKGNKITQNKKDASASSDIASITATMHISLSVRGCKGKLSHERKHQVSH